MTHASVSPEEREELGITDTLVCMYKCNQWHRKLFKGGGGGYLSYQDTLYGEKLHSYGVTVKTGGAPTP